MSLQLAADATDRFRDGVYFVPLGTIDKPELVLPTIAQALGMQINCSASTYNSNPSDSCKRL